LGGKNINWVKFNTVRKGGRQKKPFPASEKFPGIKKKTFGGRGKKKAGGEI